MKIVNTDNFGGDYPDEKFLCCGNIPIVASEDLARRIVIALNSSNRKDSPRYWIVVANDYKLQPGFEP